MALVLADRVRETTTVTGTGTATLLGAVSGYQSFSAVGNANTTYYVIANQSASEWEVGIGTYTSSGTTLSRTTVLSSSNGGSLVNFSAGIKDVFVDYPASKAVYEDASGNIDSYPITNGTINGTTVGATTPAAGTFTTLTGNSTSQFGRSSANYLQAVGGATTVAPVLSAQGSDTDIPLVLQPKGTGALQAQATTSSATGGNARGANAVDWQTGRDVAAQVASGAYSVISGGYGNRATSTYSATLSGGANINSCFQGVIAGGTNNQISSLWSGIFSGNSNVANGYYNFIGGGWTNSATSSSAVTTQSATMNATTAVTLSGSNANIKVGQYISGTSISNNTYVAAVSGTSLTLSQAASGSSTSTLSFYTPHGVVVGGGNNQATGSYSFIGGGGDAGDSTKRNTASGDWSVVCGGHKNVASGQSAFVGAGGDLTAGSIFGNTASGVTSAVVAGANNTASGYGSFIGGGGSNSVSGTYANLSGGSFSTVNSDYGSILGGTNGTTRAIVGFNAQPFCSSPIAGSAGVSQGGLLILGVQTTDATATVLRSNTSAASTTNQVILPNNSAYYFKGSVIANVTGAANGAAWEFSGAIMRGANAGSTVLIGTPVIDRVASTSGASAWTIALTADTSNGGLAVTVTGAASTTIRFVAKVETTEVTF